MISKFFKLISIYSLTLCFQIICIPNSLAQVDFDEKNIANYFSGSVSLNNNDNFQAVKYFNSTKNLKNTHDNFNRNYIISLVLDGKVSKSVSELKSTSEQNLQPKGPSIFRGRKVGIHAYTLSRSLIPHGHRLRSTLSITCCAQ